MIEHSPSVDALARHAGSNTEVDGDTPTQSGDITLTPAADPIPDSESRPADANPEPPPLVPASVASQLEAVRDVLASHSERLNELVRIGERREDQIDRLHEENQRLRAGEITLVQAPPIRELIRTYDLVLQLLSKSDNEKLGLVRDRLMDAFEQVGVRAFEANDGDAFDHDYHWAVDATPTAVETEHMTVVTTSRSGFVRVGGGVVRPADVRVRKYKRESADQVDESHDHAEPGGGR